MWEQWIHADGYIPLHYHEEEEVLVILAGAITLTLGDEKLAVRSPSTIVVPAHALHAVEPSGTDEVHLIAFFPVTAPKIYAPDGTQRPFPWEDRE